MPGRSATTWRAARSASSGRSEGVDDSHVSTHPSAPTGLYFVDHGPTGHVFSYLRAGSAASLYGPRDLPREAIASARIVQASGISQAISASACDAVFEAFALAREAGVLTAYDTNLRLKLWPLTRARAIIHAACAMADIVLPGLDDAMLLTGLQRARRHRRSSISRMGAKVVALTLGHEGSLVATPERRERLVPIKVDAIDATGAGDCYDGAFLAEYHPHRRRLCRRRLRQCRRRALDAGLWRRRALAAPRRGRGAHGAGMSETSRLMSVADPDRGGRSARALRCADQRCLGRRA